MTRAINIAQSGGNNFTMRNRVINGDMKIDQRNNGASFAATNGSYIVDRWFTNSYDAGAVTGKFTVQQNSGNAPVSQGFSQCVKITSSAATSVSSNAVYTFKQAIEGVNIADLAWGTANAKTVTLSFWVYSSLTGAFGGALQNGDTSYNYPFQYTISTANTWTYITVTVAGPTAGTWPNGTSGGMTISFGLGAGSAWTQPANSWTASTAYSANSSVNVVSTNGATWYITGVQLEAGSAATPFENRPYGMELALCQRYYYRLTGGGNTRHGISGNGSLSQGFPTVYFKVSMRTTPTFSYSSLSDFATEGIAGGGQATPNGMSWNSGTTDNATLNITSGGSGTATGVNLLGTGSGAYTAYSAEL